MPKDQDQTGDVGSGAADQTGVKGNAQGAGDQAGAGKDTVAIPDDLAASAVKDAKGEVLVPLATVLDERRKRQTLEGEVSAKDEQLYLYRMNPVTQPNAAAGGQPTGADAGAEQGNIVDTMFKDVDDAEIVNVGDLKKALNTLALTRPGVTGSADEKSQEQVGEHLLMAVHGDAEEVITTQFRQRIINEPYLVQFVNGVHPMLRPFVAYRLGKGQTIQQAQAGAAADAGTKGQGKGDQTVTKIIANADLPNATSLVATGGALSAADRFATMTDEEVEKEIENTKNR